MTVQEARGTVVHGTRPGPVYGTHDLSGSSCRVFQPRAESVACPVGLEWVSGGTSEPSSFTVHVSACASSRQRIGAVAPRWLSVRRVHRTTAVLCLLYTS